MPAAMERETMSDRRTPNHESSVGQLTAELSQQVSRLVGDETRLAQAEVKTKGKRLGSGAGLIGAGGVLAWFGFGCLVAAAVLAIDLELRAWLAALIVGAILLTGRSRMRRGAAPLPQEAMESTKKDIDAVKGHQP
jgi:Putative Actinobacterial Holin-X, holin superfamily III